MRPDISLVDLNIPDSTFGLLRIEQTIWGLSDLQRGITSCDHSSPLLPEVQTRLRRLTKIYCDNLGQDLAASLLISNGILENRDEVKNTVAGNFEQIPTDENLRIDGLYVIGIVGLIQSGKTTVGGIMAEIYRTRHYPFIDGLFAFAYAMGYNPLTMDRRELVSQVNDVIKPYLGYDRFAKTVLHRARRQQNLNPAKAITCDGFRSVPEANIVLGQEKGMLVAVQANLIERYVRASQKKEAAQRPKNFAAFRAQSNWERDHMTGDVTKMVKSKPLNNSRQDKGVYLTQQIHQHFDRILIP